MRKIVYMPTSSDFVPEPSGFFKVHVDCCQCGRRTYTAIDKDDDFDRSEAEYWEDRYKSLMGSVNSLLSYMEKTTGYNPAREKIIKELSEIRKRFS